MIQKFEFIEQYFADRSFLWKSVLDAWTGKSSAVFLAGKNPDELTLLAYEWDVRKWESTEKALIEKWYKNYKIVYGDISKEGIFGENAFDFVFADYLIWEITPAKLSSTFNAIAKFLKNTGEVVFIDRETYWWYEPKFNYVSMDKIEWIPELEKRSPRELIEIIDMFMMMTKTLTLFQTEIRTFDYPSEWILAIIQNSGLILNDVQYFESKQTIEDEFKQRIERARWRIKNLENRDISKGLLLEIEKVENEFNKRNISKDEYYLRKHYVISAKKFSS